MKALLYKELRLAMHPAALMFIALSAMLLIPNYPYYVICFYSSLGLFFICLSGRENHDIFYSLTLPVPKTSAVTARMLTAVLLELTQLCAAIPFAILHAKLGIGENLVGIDANTAFFGSSLFMLGIFNFVFFTSYYKAPEKVGKAFLLGSAAEAIYMCAAETAVHALPIARKLDTPDPENLAYKLILLAAGALLYAALTAAAHRRAAVSFSKTDI